MIWKHKYDGQSVEITFELPRDMDIHEVMDEFYLFLIACTYHPNTIKNAMREKADEEV